MLKNVLIFFASLCVLGAPIAVCGQTARFSGQVTDPQAAAIPNALVQVINKDTNVSLEVKTDGSGLYTIPYLPAGHYRILVQAPGFNQTENDDVNLAVGQAALYNVQLAIGSASSSVSVTASSATSINTDNAEVSGTITGKEVTSIGLNGRNFSQFIALAPGVSNQTQQDEAKVGGLGSVSFSVNGGRTEYNSFNVDGSETLNVGINKDHTSLIVTPSIDAIQEIKVLTSNYGAQYPSTGNGTTIVTTRSGTDAFHGSIYEFLRNEALNAKGYFDVTNGAPLYRRNDFGGTIGGPVSIPHIYEGKGRTHFFFSEEARLEKTPTAYRQSVPSLAERSGDFSDVCPAVSDSTTAINREIYPDCPSPSLGSAALGGSDTFNSNQLNNAGSGGTLNRNAVALLNTGVIPAPNATSGCNSTIDSCYNVDVSLPTYWREELFRIDHTINDKSQATFRYIHDEWDTTTPVPQYAYLQNNFPTINNRYYSPGTSLVGRLTNTLSSTLLNEFVVGYTNSLITLRDLPETGVDIQRADTQLSAPCTLDPYASQNGFSRYQCPMTSIFNNSYGGKIPGILIAGNNAAYGGNGFAVDPAYMPWEHSNPIYNISDNITKTIGRHNIGIGSQLIIFQRNQTNGPIGAATGEVQGILTFNNVKALRTTGNAFADFLNHNDSGSGTSSNPDELQDSVASFQQDSAQSRYRQRYQIVEPYFQDDWKVNSRLTLNVGLRISLLGTYHTANNNAYNWLGPEVQGGFSTSVANTLSIGSLGQLVDKASGQNLTINQSNPSSSLDPRIINGIVHCGTNGIPSSCMTGHLWNPSPRIGFALDPLGSGKTAIRGGYGIFFEHGTADEANTGSLEGGAPIVLSMTEQNPLSWSTIGQGLAFPIDVTSIPTKAVWPYIQQWSLSIERELPLNLLATLAYVGSKGTHLTATRQNNQLAPLSSANNPFGLHEPLHYTGLNRANNAGGGDCDAIQGGGSLENGTIISPSNPAYINLQAACYGAPQSPAPNPNSLRQYASGIDEIYALQNVANSAYNSFQFTIRRTQGPLSIGAAYTYSHSIDDASDRSDATFVNSFDLRSNRASSNFDQRQLFHLSYVYQLPLLAVADHLLHFADNDPTNEAANAAGHPYNPTSFQQNKLIHMILNGWEASGITLFETGIPFTVVNNGSPLGIATLDNAGAANGTGSGSYPDLSGISPHSFRPVGGSNTKSVGPLLLNPAAFVAPRGLTFGNAGRNVLNNPSRWDWDMAMLRHFPLPREGSEIQFRVEAFNFPNNTQFRIYDPVLGTQANNTISCYGGDVANYSAAGGDAVDCLTGSSFLHPVDAHRPRTLQVALKLSF